MMRQQQNKDKYVSIRNQSDREHIQDYVDMPLGFQKPANISDGELLNFTDSNIVADVEQDFAIHPKQD
jgi:hypothetical protein